MKHAAFPSVLFLFLVASCATVPNAQFESDPEADLSAYQSFALLPLPTSIPGADPGAVLRLGPMASKAVEEELVARGYKKAPLESADFAVAIKGSVVPKIQITDWGFAPSYGYGWRRGYRYGYGAGSNVTVDEYKEGTLILEVYDTKMKKLTWVGWSTEKTHASSADPEDVDAAVRTILANFPSD